jgi:hypothetical protein
MFYSTHRSAGGSSRSTESSIIDSTAIHEQLSVQEGCEQCIRQVVVCLDVAARA